ncbi:MAG: metallophosphoesterase family protein [Planctomycetota bacterium]|jgi:diadenosine tetraphosphatase ApaH/serine/threonine PP2A family protein phosphatase
MRYGLLADVHANMYAFSVALGHLEQSRVDKILFLGDLVGYGAEPAQCVDMLRSQASPPVLPISGNHDRQVLGEKDPQMRRTASRALDWTRDKLSPEHIRYLQSIPQGRVVDDVVIMVHGSLVSRDAYILSMKEVERNRKCMLEEFKGMRICFFAHTHVPMLIGMKKMVTELRETKAFQLDPSDICLVNPGSVGQPRDRCPLCSFGIFDTDNWTMTFFRLQYDVAGAQQAITAAGLPEKFARRLELGV